MYRHLPSRTTTALLILACLWSCASETRTSTSYDRDLLKIANFQDRGTTDSLLIYFRSANARYRAAAALAFASRQDTAANIQLGQLLLNDKSALVRTNAAFALGQTSGGRAVASLTPGLRDKQEMVVREVLIALGKTMTKADTAILTEYKANSSLTREGHAWGLYRLALRGITPVQAIRIETTLLGSSNTAKTRFGAASFFGRAQLRGTHFQKALITAATSDSSQEVRMAAVSGLRNLKQIARWLQYIRLRMTRTIACVSMLCERSRALIM